MNAVILVGGLGSRLLPLTKDIPKPLLPINGVPLIDIQLNRLVESGVSRVVLATCYRSEKFIEHIAKNPRRNLEIIFSFEENALGTGGAMRAAISKLDGLQGGENLFILNGDILSEHSMVEQLEAFEVSQAGLSLHTVEVDDCAPYGLIEKESSGLVTAFKEKSGEVKRGEINAGCYLVKSYLIDEFIKEDAVVSMERDFLPNIIKLKVPVTTYLDNSTWFDIGTPKSYFKANLNIVQSIREEYRDLEMFTSYVSPNAKLGNAVRLDNSIISDGVILGDNCVIRNSFISDDVVINPGQIVENTYLTLTSSELIDFR